MGGQGGPGFGQKKSNLITTRALVEICPNLAHPAHPVMPLAGGQGGLNLGVQLTLLQPRGADYAHHITASPLGFENPAAALRM